MSEERLKRAGNMDIDPDKIMFYTPEEYSMMYSDEQEIKTVVERITVLDTKLKEAVANVEHDLETIKTIEDRHLREEFIREELNYDKGVLHKLESERAQLKAKLKGLLSNSSNNSNKRR